MTRFATLLILASLLAIGGNKMSSAGRARPLTSPQPPVRASSASGQDSKQPATPEVLKAEKETRYLAFQIFTYGPNPKVATMGEGTNPQPARFPDKATLRDYIEEIKRRIGTVGDRQTRLAVMLGHLSFDHGDAETTNRQNS